MVYKIKEYSFDRAKELGVEIKASTNKKKKIDVYKNNIKIASIGAIGYMDYPSYLEINKNLAEKKRDNYWKRHKDDVNNKNGNGFYSAHILW
jgi:hypothetical protein